MQHLEPYVGQLLSDAPDHERNVFIVMRFLRTEPVRSIEHAIRSSLAANGLHALRADDKGYHTELWSNLCTYMLGCSKAIVVFEDIELREFNPNVALELGFMMALGKPVLILKEKRLPRPPTDIIGHLWREFDSYRVAETISHEISGWLVDINWRRLSRPVPIATKRLLLRHFLQLQSRLNAMHDEFNLEVDFSDSSAHTFRKVAIAIATTDVQALTNGEIIELVKDDHEMAELLSSAEKFGRGFEELVIDPLRDRSRSSADRIRTAKAATERLLSTYNTMMTNVRKACGDIHL
jgi:hypothetical protein